MYKNVGSDGTERTMKVETALEKRPKATVNNPYVVEAEKLLERMRELSQSVARRAYEFFEERGGEIGHSLEDWFRAETELLRRVPIELTETETQFKVRAEVPGFTPEEIKVSVEPGQLIVSGESEIKGEEKAGEIVYNERRSRRFCRTVDLPAEVDPGRASAVLSNGVLELTLQKRERVPASNLDVKGT
jgi:HSP20 family protein